MTIKEFAREVKKELLCDSLLQMERKGSISLDKLVHCVEVVEDQADQERTNFEKWKEELTVEELARIMRCAQCPTKDKCYDLATGGYPVFCKERLTEWANMRCE